MEISKTRCFAGNAHTRQSDIFEELSLLMVTNMLLFSVVEIHQYIDSNGKNYFEEWFSSLSAAAAAKVTTALARLEMGNWSNVKGVGSGVYEYRIDFGPGYRLYFGKDGDRIVILLTGGSKKRQQRDIENAIESWQRYKERKEEINAADQRLQRNAGRSHS